MGLLKKIQDDKLDEAEAMLKGFANKGTQPDVVSYNHFIQATANQGNLYRATQFFELMKQAGVDPTTVTYNILLTALSRAQDPNGAAVWLENLLSSGLEATEVCFATVIRAHVKAGDAENASKWFDRMIVAGIEPTSMSYNQLIQDCARRGDLKGAEVLLAEALARGLLLGAATFQYSDHCFCQLHEYCQSSILVGDYGRGWDEL